MFILSGLVLILSTSCSNESISENALEERKSRPIPTPETTVDLSNLNDACVTVRLIAGQHHVAGDVSVYNDGENLIVVFESNGDWILGTTHLSLGNCDENWVPTTRSGNPRIGQFQYTVPYSISDHEVVYVIPLAGLDTNYCFAAHAEVQGPTGGETAWAEGDEFSGNSWAMFVEALLTDCPPTDGGGENGPT